MQDGASIDWQELAQQSDRLRGLLAGELEAVRDELAYVMEDAANSHSEVLELHRRLGEETTAARVEIEAERTRFENEKSRLEAENARIESKLAAAKDELRRLQALNHRQRQTLERVKGLIPGPLLWGAKRLLGTTSSRAAKNAD